MSDQQMTGVIQSGDEFHGGEWEIRGMRLAFSVTCHHTGKGIFDQRRFGSFALYAFRCPHCGETFSIVNPVRKERRK